MEQNGKIAVARKFAAQIPSKCVLGAGTGSTVDQVLIALKERSDLECVVVPTSWKTSATCRSLGLTVLDLAHAPEIDLGFDGADRIRLDTFEAVKGGGGALADEGIMAQLCKRYAILVDESKVVSKLTSDYALPVEVDRCAAPIVDRFLKRLGATKTALREGKAIHDPASTHRGNFIIDATFDTIDSSLVNSIKAIHGVAFVGFWPTEWTQEVWVGKNDGSVSTTKR